ncbi:MAG: hypothetical protein KKF33_10295 [Alphaproteobacteria bacterium]|nr:hypothetical protein [Alphaproteobacteria bacterium]
MTDIATSWPAECFGIASCSGASAMICPISSITINNTVLIAVMACTLRLALRNLWLQLRRDQGGCIARVNGEAEMVDASGRITASNRKKHGIFGDASTGS